MSYTVYVIKSKKGMLYKGITNFLERRLLEHNTGMSRWTKGKGPFELVYKEEVETKKEALKRENFLKSGQGRAYLKSILGNEIFGE